MRKHFFQCESIRQKEIQDKSLEELIFRSKAKIRRVKKLKNNTNSQSRSMQMYIITMFFLLILIL